MILTRRKLIGGMGLLFAAPAIVRASSLMPVKVPALAEWTGVFPRFVVPELEPSVWLVQWGPSTVTQYYGADLIPALGLEGIYSPVSDMERFL